LNNCTLLNSLGSSPGAGQRGEETKKAVKGKKIKR